MSRHADDFDAMTKTVRLSEEIEDDVEILVSEGTFHSFETAVNELVRLGLMQIGRRKPDSIPPGNIPSPERPNIPDPTRDILRM